MAFVYPSLMVYFPYILLEYQPQLLIKINSDSKRSMIILCIKKTKLLKYTDLGAQVQGRPVYRYYLNEPSVFNLFFNKTKLTSQLGKSPTLSLKILSQ